eukprot:SAG31_NODE_3346_length_4376_cov_3.801496_3_plen_211_part_00
MAGYSALLQTTAGGERIVGRPRAICLSQRGICYEKLGREARARADYAAALELDNDVELALAGKARLDKETTMAVLAPSCPLLSTLAQPTPEPEPETGGVDELQSEGQPQSSEVEPTTTDIAAAVQAVLALANDGPAVRAWFSKLAANHGGIAPPAAMKKHRCLVAEAEELERAGDYAAATMMWRRADRLVEHGEGLPSEDLVVHDNVPPA